VGKYAELFFRLHFHLHFHPIRLADSHLPDRVNIMTSPEATGLSEFKQVGRFEQCSIRSQRSRCDLSHPHKPAEASSPRGPAVPVAVDGHASCKSQIHPPRNARLPVCPKPLAISTTSGKTSIPEAGRALDARAVQCNGDRVPAGRPCSNQDAMLLYSDICGC